MRPGWQIPCSPSASNGRSRSPCSPRRCSGSTDGASPPISPTAGETARSCSPTPRRRRRPAIIRRARAAGAKAACCPAEAAGEGGRGRAAGFARGRLPQRVLKNRRANVGARGAAAVRPAGRPRGVARTDRTRDVPALWALRWREPEGPQPSWTRNSATCRRRRAGANGWAGSRRSSSPR